MTNTDNTTKNAEEYYRPM